MVKKNFLTLVITFFFILISSQTALAGNIGVGVICPHRNPNECVDGYSCYENRRATGTLDYRCQPRIGVSERCDLGDPDPCLPGYSCYENRGYPLPNTDYRCQRIPQLPRQEEPYPSGFESRPQPSNAFSNIFGTIRPPDALKDFVTKNPTGALGISSFLSALVALFYSIAAIVLIFMLIWGAFDWLISGGDKEKIESARRRIISAIIGIMLFAVAFAIIQILGNFTGFKFFVGQK